MRCPMSMERERSRMSEDIKPAVNPLNFHEMGTDANAPDAASLVPCPEPAIETPGRKRPATLMKCCGVTRYSE